jgi:hypothetical protein
VINFHKLNYPFIFLIVIAHLLLNCASFANTSSFSDFFSHSKRLPTFSKNTNKSISVICNTPPKSNNSYFFSVKSLRQTSIARFLLLLWLVSFLFKGPSKQFFKICLKRLQYFLVDLDVSILSSRAHPPTH